MAASWSTRGCIRYNLASMLAFEALENYDSLIRSKHQLKTRNCILAVYGISAANKSVVNPPTASLNMSRSGDFVIRKPTSMKAILLISGSC